MQHAPGVPKILVGNRLHLAFKRQVSESSAEAYALKNDMAFFEVSPLCDFNVTESFAELSRVALKRHGMSRTWGPSKGWYLSGCRNSFQAARPLNLYMTKSTPPNLTSTS